MVDLLDMRVLALQNKTICRLRNPENHLGIISLLQYFWPWVFWKQQFRVALYQFRKWNIAIEVQHWCLSEGFKRMHVWGIVPRSYPLQQQHKCFGFVTGTLHWSHVHLEWIMRFATKKGCRFLLWSTFQCQEQCDKCFVQPNLVSNPTTWWILPLHHRALWFP